MGGGGGGGGEGIAPCFGAENITNAAKSWRRKVSKDFSLNKEQFFGSCLENDIY